jgi:type IV pilus assembly protein PilW
MQFFNAELKKVGYPKTGFSGNPLSATNNSGENQSDTLTLSYQDGKDCAGSSAATIRYYLDSGDLRCDGNGSASPTPQSLASHVDGLQFRFGADLDSDGAIDHYLEAHEVSNWEQVHTITTAILLRSELAVRDSKDEATYPLLNSDYGPFNDYHLRKIYQITTQLRNH